MDGESRENVPQNPIDVEVAEHNQGLQLNGNGASFNLRLLCRDPWTYTMTTADKMYDRVYFRTESGNIYSLDPKGTFINSNESRKAGKYVGMQLNPRELERQRIYVGEPFRFGQGGHTTTITEIVAVRNRQIWQQGLPYSPIVDDFKRGLPPERK